MDGDESGLTSYYHHHHHPQHHHPTTTTPTTASNTNGVFSDPHHHQQQHHQHQQHQHQHHQQQQHNQSAGHYSSEPTPLAYPQHSVTGRAPPPPPPSLTSSTPPPPPETVKRKRGRPRKYGTPEALQAASASVSSAKKFSTSSPSSVPLPSSPRKKDPSSLSSSKKNQLSALGNAGQNFIPHIITVTAGEDVAQKIMSFMQQRKRAVCILSASGSVSNASLRQPATLGGTVTYEGRFEILSLSGSFLHTEIEGGSSRTGGLSVCLSGTDGRIIGGGVGGPLKAAGPVQVIIGSFVIDNKETNVESKFETSSSKLPQVIGATFSSAVYGSPDSSGRNSGRGNNDHQNMGVNNFMIQSRGMHSMPSQSNDWRDSPGLTDHGACQSSEDGDDGNLQH